MGAGRKTQTILVPEKTQPSCSVNSSASARNLPKSELRGGIFVCSNVTIGECFKKGLFGLPDLRYLFVKKVAPGMPLFLFNYSDRKLHGIFEATSHGQLNIDPFAWTESDSDSTPFPAQVKFRIREKCQPLMEDQFRQILAKNYYDDKHFWYELDENQTTMLVALFSSRGEGVKRSNRAYAPRNEQIPKDQPGLPQVEDWEDLVDDPQPKRDEHRVAESSSAHIFSCSPSGFDSSRPQKSWSALFKDEVPSSKATEAVEETECVEEENFSADSQEESFFSSPRATASIEALLRDDQGPADGPMETEMKPSDLLNTVANLSQNLEEMKWLHSLQSEKIRSLEQKLDKSEVRFKEVEEWFFKMKSILTPEELEHDAILESNNDIHPELERSVIIAGGFDDSYWFSSLVSYSPSKDSVTFLPDMTGPRSYASAVNLNGEFCVIGGACRNEWYKTVELYSPVNELWTPLPSLSQEKGGLSAISLHGKIFAVGGGTRKDYFSEVEMLDPNAGRWIPIRSMLHKRFATAAAEINGVLYAVGGSDGEVFLDSTERFDPRENIWTRMANMNMKRGFHCLVVLNGKLYALGGVDGSSVVPSVEVFDPRVGSWIFERPMNIPRVQFGAAAIKDEIYVFGGHAFDNSHKLETIERFRSDRGWLGTGLRGFGKRCAFASVVL